MRDKVTRQCPQTTTFEDRGDPKREQNRYPSACQPIAHYNYFKAKPAHLTLSWWRWWWYRASCPRMSADILGTNCDQWRSIVQCCFTSTETVRFVRTESHGRPPRLSHSSGTLTSSTQLDSYHPLSFFLSTDAVPSIRLAAHPEPIKKDTGSQD